MPPSARTAEDADAAIRRFLSASKSPVLLEPGEPEILLTSENCHLDWQAGRLSIQAWDERRSLHRRVTGVKDERPGRLELIVERFGKAAGTLELLDLAKPKGAQGVRRASRLTYRERFRRSLVRQFPGWSVETLSAEPDLEHSLSPAYPRALIGKGPAAWVAIGAPPESDAPAALTFGLIWLDYVRQRERRRSVEGLLVFAPAGGERVLASRLLHLNASLAQWRLFAYDDAFESELDLRDYGNVNTQITPRRAGEAQREAGGLAAALLARSEVEAVECGDGSRSFRVRGLEIAREHGGELRFGLDAKRAAAPGDTAEVLALVREVARMRSVRTADRNSTVYLRHPELWLESQVRADVQVIDPSLRNAPVYGQVPAMAAGERGVIDLLAVDHQGGLAVVELKASEDPHLPLQALDYWIRVHWHLGRREFTANGYFPGIGLLEQPPRLLLVAPALAFHPTTAGVLSWFHPSIEVERVGLGMNWRERLEVAFRMRGSETR